MHKRCKPDARDAFRYFGRGVRVCEEWNDWPTFCRWAWSNGYTDELEIDRIDGSKGYEPQNCRFVNGVQQEANKDKDRVRAIGRAAQRQAHYCPIVCVERAQQFNSQAEAAQELGLVRQSIGDVLNGRYKSTGSYRFLKLKDYNAIYDEVLT